MEPTRWQRIEKLFHAALPLDRTERRGLLDREAGTDAELRTEVESLLIAHDEADSMLERAAVARVADGDVGWHGRRMGPWRLIEEIGRGGMSRVWLAERADGEFDRRVAIKIIRRGLDSPELLARFRRERQILARLEHPWIAGLLDGGTTDDDVPYLVMEHIEGRAIDRYCDEERLTVDGRLELFDQVLEAVSFAHRNLVVHRDLKPSNILVRSGGEPKLLDFGIAKLLEADSCPATVTAEARPLTPQYASPEQVQGGAITTAADVYSLGVVLYELLSGGRPDSARERLEDGGTRSPGPPSEALTDEAGPARSTPLRRLRGQLEGDLDRISSKALHLDPEERYASVEELRQDLRRHRQGLPVLARGDSMRYRAGKYWRRNRVALTVFAGVLSLVLSFAVFALLQAERLGKERDLSAAEHSRAETVTEFLVGLFELADPEISGHEVTAKEIVDRAAGDVQRGLATDPRLRAVLQREMGRIYVNLGLYDEAQAPIEDSVRLFRGMELQEPSQLASSLYRQGVLESRRGELEAALSALGEAMELRRAHTPEALGELAGTASALAAAHRNAGEFERAEALHREAVAFAERDDPTGEVYVQVASNYGVFLHQRGDLEQARHYYERSMAVQRRRGDLGTRALAQTLHNLGSVLTAGGDSEAGAERHREAVDLREALYGDDHPLVASTLNELGHSLHSAGRLDEALALYERALRIQIESLGAGNVTTLTTQFNLAALHREAGRLEEAELGLRAALGAAEQALPPGHYVLSHFLGGLGRVVLDRGRPEEAESLFRDCLEIREQAMPEGHWRIEEARSAVGSALLAQGLHAEAEPLLREAFPVLRDTAGSEVPATERTRSALVALYRATGRPELAAPYEALDPGRGEADGPGSAVP